MIIINSTKQLGDLLIAINKELKTRVERELKSYDIGMGQLQILMLFYAQAESSFSQNDLVKLLDVDKGNISRSIKKLMDKTLIEQVRGNSRVYKLSDKGRSLKEDILKTFIQINNYITVGIKEQELEQTLKVLQQIAHNLEVMI